VTRDKHTPDAFEKMRQDIYESLMVQPFPIRGWHLGMTKAPGRKGLYGVCPTDVPKDAEGLPVVGKGQLPVLFGIDAVELTLTADFRLESCTHLGGRKWECPPEAVERQWLRFANTNGTLEITLDAKYVPPFQERLFYPDREVWMEQVNEWSKKWLKSGKKDNESRWVLVQLEGIRNSGNHMLMQSMSRLVQRIERDVPNYWFFAELAMAGRLTENEIQVLENYEVGKGAITIRQRPRPQMVPTEKVQ
jgi:hypothetical protein